MQNQNEKIDKAIETIKGKMKLLNFNNMKPPYFLHTLTKFRATYLSSFIKEVNLEGKETEEVREKLKTVHYIIEKFDDEYFDAYAEQLLEPYTRKMFQDNYGFDAVDFKEANSHYKLKSQIQETLAAAAQWLTQIQITQDLLSRVQLYFKLTTPHVIEKVRIQGFNSEKDTWSGTITSYFKRMMSYSLRKGSKIVQSTFWTALAPSAIMLTLAIMGGTSTLPWKTSLDINTLIPAVAVIAIPYALDSMADSVQKSDCAQTLRKWTLNFTQLAQNITKFNQCLQNSIRNCTISTSIEQFEKQRTNLEKIIFQLNKNSETVTCFTQQKLQQMRERTQAYFKQYIEVADGSWTVVIAKEDQQSLKKLQTMKKNDSEQFEVICLNKDE